MLYREIAARGSKNLIRHRNLLCGHNAEFCNVNNQVVDALLLSRKTVPALTAVKFSRNR